MLAIGKWRRCCRLSKREGVLAQAQGIEVRVRPAAGGVDMELWGETLHVVVVVIVVAEGFLSITLYRIFMLTGVGIRR